ncbi:MAG: hypothetical protein JHC76_03165 [Akkermansiaceae bacterium]|nr:hypothetical protein [Akkermansiaceae bacterium]
MPLSFLVLFTTLFVAALHFPESYDWQRRVISHLISPRHNPDGFLIPSLGMAFSALLVLPLGGYIGRRLWGISRLLAQWVSGLLGAGIFLVVTVTLPLNVESMPASVHWVHEALARLAAVGMVGGMICCCVGGLKDRFGGKQTLSPLMVTSWSALTLIPVICGILAGILRLARKADFEWAHQLRQLLRSTMVMQLAFWEWVGVVAFILFLVSSVLFLPPRVKTQE